MKQTRFWLVIIAVLLCRISTSAYDFEVDGIYYDIISTENLTVKVTNGDNKYCGNVVIPSTINYKSRTLTVASIGKTAFGACSRLTSITIPNSIVDIEEGAFGACSRLTSITIPNSITNIDDNAFEGCISLKELYIEDGTDKLCLGLGTKEMFYDGTFVYYIYRGLFHDCPLETLYLGRDIEYDYFSNLFNSCQSPFYENKTLTKVTISDSVTNIGPKAFSGCSGLTSITIPNSITNIDDNAFDGCI